MKSKEGAVLIGMHHAGIENAQNVIDTLKENGFGKGDEIALETTESELAEERTMFKLGAHSMITRNYYTDIKSVEQKIQDGRAQNKSVRPLQRGLSTFKREIGNTLFTATLMPFLLLYNTKITPPWTHSIHTAKQTRRSKTLKNGAGVKRKNAAFGINFSCLRY